MNEPIRTMIPYEEFDYQTLLEALKGYAHPRDRITTLLCKGVIIRVKKGLYVFGEDDRKHPYSREILANLIYGPSYISLETALWHYGLIPERVESLTSVTVGRSRKFSTPLGLFVYRMIPMAAFQVGMDQAEMADGRSYLIAVPEKALADKLRADRVSIRSQRDVQSWLFDDLRMDPDAIQKMQPARLEVYANCYHSRKILLLSKLVRRLGRAMGGADHA